MKLTSAVILWLLLFLICAGLGYPSLRRFDPRDPRTNFDSSHALYHALASGDAKEAAPYDPLLHFRYRLLVPMVARPFYLLGKGRVGTWEPGYFGLLMANSIFCSTTALLLFLLARDMLAGPAALVPSLLYLLSFGVANYHLAGLVDTGEAFAFMALVWCLRRERWLALPMLGIVGALAKETFVPLSLAFVAGWIAVDWHRAVPRRAIGFVLLAVTGLGTLIALFSIGNGHLIFPWELARSGRIFDSVWQRASALTDDIGLLYLFGWLAPLGAWGLFRCSRPWVAGAAVSAATVVALGIYNGEPGVSRTLFDIAGPLLSMASAVTIAKLLPG
jgi:hypothetical protein